MLPSLRPVELAWTGDIVQETSADGDPQSNGAAESAVNVVIRACEADQAGRRVPADHDLLTWLVPQATSMHRRS